MAKSYFDKMGGEYSEYQKKQISEMGFTEDQYRSIQELLAYLQFNNWRISREGP